MSLGEFLLIHNNQMLSQSEEQLMKKEEEKVFIWKNLQCTHRYSESINKRQTFEADSQKCMNQPSHCRENVIYKQFQLCFPHHVLTFSDSYRLDCLPSTQNTSQIPQQSQPFNALQAQPSPKKTPLRKLVLFRSNMRGGGAHDKGDKKNIAKNVVTAFLNYLRDLRQEGNESQRNVTQLRELIDKNKYNNQLINEIIQCGELRNYFKEFLSQFALNWVHHSKLKNKEIHEEAIVLYERLCEEKEGQYRRQNADRVQVEPDKDENEFYFQSGINHELQEVIEKFK